MKGSVRLRTTKTIVHNWQKFKTEEVLTRRQDRSYPINKSFFVQLQSQIIPILKHTAQIFWQMSSSEGNFGASSAGSFPLQQACLKVVSVIARDGIDPTTTEDRKRRIIHSLCEPLSDSLLGSQECLASGAALCLKVLVDSDNRRFASDEMVNKVCQNVAGALGEKSTQANSRMGLVMSLAKRNGLIVEAYERLLIQSGLQILRAGVAEGNSQKRLLAIQMVNYLMKSLDPWSTFSELKLIIEEMEKCQSDKMAYVRGAAFEALQSETKRLLLRARKSCDFFRWYDPPMCEHGKRVLRRMQTMHERVKVDMTQPSPNEDRERANARHHVELEEMGKERARHRVELEDIEKKRARRRVELEDIEKERVHHNFELERQRHIFEL
ncbi:hypothetical protein CJ030_MR6G016560 [Morella rubra]|uniref:Uncharacterized protein n=1 Tax=Morella rubra TaxID=262757 RepID=A0A6A1VC11_9ROSI|nr:hypothetical protein CJ030_MR6G016560 [Morella rubra]